MKKKLKICLIGNTKSIHFIKNIDKIFKTVNSCVFHIIDVQTDYKPAVKLPVNSNLIYHIITSSAKSKIKYFLNFFKIRAIIKKVKPDIIHCYGAGLYGFLGLILNFHPLIISVYGTEVYSVKNKSFAYKKILSKILKNADLITYASDGMRQFLINYFNISLKKLVKIYWGIDPKIFNKFSDFQRSDLRNKLGISKKDIAFFSNRRILPLYNIDIIIKTFYKVNQLFSNTKLILIKGDVNESNSYYLRIKKYIQSGIAKKNIILIDKFVAQKRIAELYNISNAFIGIPDSDELSASVLEGIACSSMPIITNLNAYEELKRQCSILFIKNSKHANELEEKMLYLIKNYDKIKQSIQDQNYAYITKYLTYQAVKKDILKLYETSISKF